MNNDRQRTAAWLQQRCGKVTASRISDLIARTKTGWAASRETYLNQLMVERLTGGLLQSASTPAMRWGCDCEPWAKAAYAFFTDQEVAQIGLVEHPSIAMSGASPDGLVGEAGLIEIKCPTTATHLETLAQGEVPMKHRPQIQWQLACTGRLWCDFVSFDPRLPQDLSLMIRRVERDDAFIAELEGYVVAFLEELEARLAGVRVRAREAYLPCCA